MNKTITFDDSQYRLVPVEPTEEMEHAAVKDAPMIIKKHYAKDGKFTGTVSSLDSAMFGNAYRAMLAAVPADLPGLVKHSGEPALYMYDHDGCMDRPITSPTRWAEAKEPWTETALYDHAPKDGSEKDAQRWRALLNIARIRPLGSAGIKSKLDPYGEPYGGYAHLGLELWTKFNSAITDEQKERLANENTLGREWLTAFADIAIDAAKGPTE